MMFHVGIESAETAKVKNKISYKNKNSRKVHEREEWWVVAYRKVTGNTRTMYISGTVHLYFSLLVHAFSLSFHSRLPARDVSSSLYAADSPPSTIIQGLFSGCCDDR